MPQAAAEPASVRSAPGHRHRRAVLPNGQLCELLHSKGPCCPQQSAAMELAGACRCGAVSFTCKSHTPVPFMRCYCTICRKARVGLGCERGSGNEAAAAAACAAAAA